MNAINIIKSEHRALRAMLFTLSQLVQEVRSRQSEIDFVVFHGIVYYLRSFLDRYHHPKESEFLFPMVKKRCPGASEILVRLEEQHDDGEDLLAAVLFSLSAWEFLGPAGFDDFEYAVKIYVEFERNHATLEEQEILPMAQEFLAPDDWQTINDAFADNQDPLFGDKPKHEFQSLFDALARIIPAPYGYGESLK